MVDRIWPIGEPADLRVVEVRGPQMHLARALVLAARLDRLDLGHHLGRYLLARTVSAWWSSLATRTARDDPPPNR